MADAVELEQAAIRLLCNREHSQAELRRKLAQRADSSELLEQVLTALAANNYQSDDRFTEQYVHSRMLKGYGPVRIRQELQARGVDAGLIDHWLERGGGEWRDLLQQALRKKFGDAVPVDFKQQARQARFLEYRGFPTEWVRQHLWRAE